MKLIKTLILIHIYTFAYAQGQENFDNINNLNGWLIINNSTPIGVNNWFQGDVTKFASQSGADNSYIAADHQGTGLDFNGNTNCNYLIMPPEASGELTFWTRSRLSDDETMVFPDRLYVVFSPSGAFATGNCLDDFGDFTEEIFVINPKLSSSINGFPEGYPLFEWQEFTVDIPANGRAAFVHYVTNGGPHGINAKYVGIDSVSWTGNSAEIIFNNGFE